MTYPKEVDLGFLSYEHIVDIAAGSKHTVILTNLGKVYGTGRGHVGELGLPLETLSSIDDFQESSKNWINGI